MRVFQISPGSVVESEQIPADSSDSQTVWISCSRVEFDARQAEIQAALHNLCGMQLVDLHVSDLLNRQLPSRLTTRRNTICWFFGA